MRPDRTYLLEPRTASRRLRVLLWGWAVVCALPYLSKAPVSWHFFVEGSRLIAGGGPGAGVHLYAQHPDLQIGPLTFVVGIPLAFLPSWAAETVGMAAMAATGPILLLSLAGLVAGDRRRHTRRMLLAGLVFLPLWDELAVHYAHLDDALALALAVAAVHAVVRRRPLLAAALLAGAADAKPWAAAFAALLLVFTGRRLLKAVAVWAAGVAVAWLPFVLGDPRTVSALGHFRISESPSSALHVFGVNAARTPFWDRPVQLLLGLMLGALLVRRGRWPAVLLVAVAARVLFDPATYPYYTSGVVLAAVVFDLLLTTTTVPLMSVTAVLGLYVVRFIPLAPLLTQSGLAALRAAFVVLAVVLAFGLPTRDVRWMGRRAGAPPPVAPSGEDVDLLRAA